MTFFKRSTVAGVFCAVVLGLTAVGTPSAVSARQLSGYTYDNAQRVPIVTPLYVPSASRYTVSVYCEAGETIEFFGNNIKVPEAVVPCVPAAGGKVGQATATLTAPNISPAPAIESFVITRVKNAAGEYTFFNSTLFLVYTDLLNTSYNGAERLVEVKPSANTIRPGDSFTVEMECYSTEVVEYSFGGTTGKATCSPTFPYVATAKFVAPPGTYPMTGTFTLPGIATYTFVVGLPSASSTTVVTPTTSVPGTAVPGSTIPFTGASSQTVPLTGAAIALALTGACLAFISRRRRAGAV